MITTDGEQWILKYLLGTPGSPVNYLAVGDNPPAPAKGDKKLAGEVARVPVTSIYQDGGTVVFETFVDKLQANFNWREAGLFAGGDASLDTGILVARANIDEDKDQMKTATVLWEIGF